MNRAIDPKTPNAVVPVAPPQVPAIPKPISGWKKFRRLCEDIEDIKARYDEMVELIQRVDRPPSDQSPYSAIALEHGLRRAQLLDDDKQKIERCWQWLHDFDHADHYEDGDEYDEKPILTKKAISERLSLTLGAVHIGGPQTPEAFLKMLLEHVYDAEVSWLALESTCRQIEETEKYVQAISEVLIRLREHEQQWQDRKWALNHIERTSNELQNDIREAQARYERQQVNQRVAQAKNRVAVKSSSVRFTVRELIAAQESAREIYQKMETAMQRLVQNQQQLDEAKAELEAAIAATTTAAEELIRFAKRPTRD